MAIGKFISRFTGVPHPGNACGLSSQIILSRQTGTALPRGWSDDAYAVPSKPGQMDMPLIDSTQNGTRQAVGIFDQVSSSTLRKFSSEKLAYQLEAFPPIPATAMEVVRLAESPDSNLSEIESVLSQDPVLTARVFKMANSSFFSRGVVSTTLQSACSRLGLTALRNMVIACCAGQIINAQNNMYCYKEQGMWIHSLYAALGSEYVATWLNKSTTFRDEVFLSALLHDMGKMLLNPLINHKIMGSGQYCLASEQQVLGITHTQVGVTIMELWKLPDYCRSVVEYHHKVENADSHQMHVAVVHLVDWMLNHNKIAIFDHCDTDPDPDPAALEILSLSTADFTCLVADFQSNLEMFGATSSELL